MKKMMVALMAAVLAIGAETAHAGGLIADVLIRPISPNLADAADQANTALGHPVEQAAAAAAKALLGF